ncbi:MAG: shikimate dehydrogenase [Clostridiales bacterium]|nr:shikimate dehydrogenase [Clostridiales bacterium]MDY2833832.1 shikimate dehydrogenase [Candidatus Aphodomonas sp.]
MRDITVTTKMIPLLGKPLGQSVSSKISNTMYERYGIDVVRFPIECEKEDLPVLVAGLRKMNINGLGVTKPYKVEILKYLDGTDELAGMIGASNRVVMKDGKLIGTNVDGRAFTRALRRETGINIGDKKYLCLGAGGVGKPICWTLIFEGAKKVYIRDKFNEASKELADRINAKYPGTAIYLPYEDDAALAAAAKDSDVIINATGLGMPPHKDETPIAKELIEPRHICFECIYNPAVTLFMQEAREQGATALSGKVMLINCAMMGFEALSDVEVPYEEWEKLFDEAVAAMAVK